MIIYFYYAVFLFFTYGLSLGDEVETDESYVVKRVIKPSGQFTFRIWFGNSTVPTIKDEVLQKMKQLNVQFEWSSDNLLAISAESSQAQQVADYLSANHKAKRLGPPEPLAACKRLSFVEVGLASQNTDTPLPSRRLEIETARGSRLWLRVGSPV